MKPKSSAARQRSKAAYRARAKRGEAVARVRYDRRTVNILVRLGLLPDADQHSREAIADALAAAPEVAVNKFACVK